MPITVRAIGGKGEDVFDDPGKNGKVHFYDESGPSTAVGHGVEHQAVAQAARPATWDPVTGEPASLRRRWSQAARISASCSAVPRRSSAMASARCRIRASGASGWAMPPRRRPSTATSWATFGWRTRPRTSLSSLRGSGIATLNFYGFGNTTPETEAASFYRVRQTAVHASSQASLRTVQGDDADAVTPGGLFRHRRRRRPFHRDTDRAGHRRFRPGRRGGHARVDGPRSRGNGGERNLRLGGRIDLRARVERADHLGRDSRRPELVLEPVPERSQAHHRLPGRGRQGLGRLSLHERRVHRRRCHRPQPALQSLCR